MTASVLADLGAALLFWAVVLVIVLIRTRRLIRRELQDAVRQVIAPTDSDPWSGKRPIPGYESVALWRVVTRDGTIVSDHQTEELARQNAQWGTRYGGEAWVLCIVGDLETVVAVYRRGSPTAT